MFNLYPTSSAMQTSIEARKYKDSDFLLIGEEPFALNEQGKIKFGVHTFFIGYKVYITIPGMHSTQRELFIDYLNQERASNGQPKLTSCEANDIKDDSVAIAVQINKKTGKPIIWVRNDCNEARAIRARKVLSEVFPEDQIQIM